MLRVYQVLTPIVGSDWHLTIPGPYPWTLLAVQTVLDTRKNPVTIPDDSGNGHPLSVNGVKPWTFGNPGPFGGGPNNYAAGLNVPAFVAGGSLAQNADVPAWNVANYTLEAWCNINSLNTTDLSGIMGLATNGGNIGIETMCVLNNASNPWDFASYITGARPTLKTGFASRGAWLHVALSWDGAAHHLYLNGAAVGIVNDVAPLADAHGWHVVVGGSDEDGGGHGLFGPAAFYGAALTAGQLAAHAVAVSSYAAYKAAVLADGPLGLWGLNQIPQGTSRTVTLEITDGTHAVLDVAGGTITGTVGPYEWVWTTGSVGGVQTPAAAISQVPLPAMTLPPGYTIQTKTPDITATDRWTSIFIWYDDGTGGPGGPGTVDYLDAIITDTGQTGAPGAGDYTDQILIG